MFRSTLLTLGVLVALGGATSGAGAASAKPNSAKPNTLTSAEVKAGWKLLFDGKTTKGWRGYQKADMPPGWEVKDGALTLAKPGHADIVTVDEYASFELVFEWRVHEGGNSGLIYRVAETEKQPYLTGPEYQLLDEERHPDAMKGAEGSHRSGALYDVYPPSKSVCKPAMQWNASKVVLNGNHVEHWLNGVKVVEAEIGSDDWKTRVALSKWAKAEKFAKASKGFIDFQDHGDPIELRSIKLRVLK